MQSWGASRSEVKFWGVCQEDKRSGDRVGGANPHLLQGRKADTLRFVALLLHL